MPAQPCSSLGLVLALSPARRAGLPTKPVRLVIPFRPRQQRRDRPPDRHPSRRAAGQAVVVDNRGPVPAAWSNRVRTEQPHDGYTILIISLAYSVNPWLYKLPYDRSRRSRRLHVRLGSNVVVCIRACRPLDQDCSRSPRRSRANCVRLAGIGSFQHLGGELFKLMAGVNILHVPFKGGGPAMIDVLGATIKVMSRRWCRPRRISRPASCAPLASAD